MEKRQGKIVIDRNKIIFTEEENALLQRIEADEDNAVRRKLWYFDNIYCIHLSGRCEKKSRKKGSRLLLVRQSETEYKCLVSFYCGQL